MKSTNELENLHKIYELLNGGFTELGFELSKTLLGYNEVDLIELLWVLVGKLYDTEQYRGHHLSLNRLELDYTNNSPYTAKMWIWKDKELLEATPHQNDMNIISYINLLKNG